MLLAEFVFGHNGLRALIHCQGLRIVPFEAKAVGDICQLTRSGGTRWFYGTKDDQFLEKWDSRAVIVSPETFEQNSAKRGKENQVKTNEIKWFS